MREIKSTENGFCVVDENGVVVEEFDRDNVLDNLIKIIDNNEKVKEALDRAINSTKQCVLDVSAFSGAVVREMTGE